jgi:hypothetical protein
MHQTERRLWVAVAFVGSLLSCTDCFSGPQISPNLQDVTTNGQSFLAVGADGRLYITTSLETWTPSSPLTSNAFRSVHFDGAKYIAAGDRGTVAKSNDNWTWSTWDWSSNGAGDFWSVGSCNGVSYVVGTGGWAIVSTDGNNWKKLTGFSSDADLVAFACSPKGALIASTWQDAGMYFSPDGGSVTQGPAPGDTCTITFNADVWVAVTEAGSIYTSSNRLDWTLRASALWTLATDCDAAFGSGTFVVVSSEGVVVTSGDAVNWTPLDYGETHPLTGVTIDPAGKMVAVGPDGTALESQCSGGSCTAPIVHQVRVPAPESESGGGGGGSGSASCAGGWMGSVRSCQPLGSGGTCSCNDFSTNMCITQSEFYANTGRNLPSACLPAGQTGCLEITNSGGLLVHPCCPGLSCKSGSPCGSPSNSVCN